MLFMFNTINGQHNYIDKRSRSLSSWFGKQTGVILISTEY